MSAAFSYVLPRMVARGGYSDVVQDSLVFEEHQ